MNTAHNDLVEVVNEAKTEFPKALNDLVEIMPTYNVYPNVQSNKTSYNESLAKVSTMQQDLKSAIGTAHDLNKSVARMINNLTTIQAILTEDRDMQWQTTPEFSDLKSSSSAAVGMLSDQTIRYQQQVLINVCLVIILCGAVVFVYKNKPFELQDIMYFLKLQFLSSRPAQAAATKTVAAQAPVPAPAPAPAAKPTPSKP